MGSLIPNKVDRIAQHIMVEKRGRVDGKDKNGSKKGNLTEIS